MNRETEHLNDPKLYTPWIAQAIKDCEVKDNTRLGIFLRDEYGTDTEQYNKWIKENYEIYCKTFKNNVEDNK